MTRSAARPRLAILTAVTLVLSTLLAVPAAALVDPDGNPVIVDHGLRDDGATTSLLSPAFARASAIEAAKAPRAKKKLKTLVIPLYWAGARKDTSNAKIKKRVKASMKKADTYFRTVSRGRIGHSTTALGWRKIPRPSVRCGIWDQMEHLGKHGEKQARKAGKNPAKFDRVIFYVTQGACGPDHYGVAGLGSLPGRYVFLEGTLAPNVVIHELGHNLGLGHSNYAKCTTKRGTRDILGPSKRCEEMEYADATDVMGNHPDAGWFSAPKLARLGWYTKKNLAKNTSTKKKTYLLRPAAASSKKLKAVRVKGTQGRHYWLEYRARTGLDSAIAPGLAGVQIRLGRPNAWQGDSVVLDMLPASYYDWFDVQSVALAARASWTSPEGIKFTVRKIGKSAKVTVERKARKARKPLAPAPQAAARDLGAALSWSAPKDRGTPIQSYTVRARSAAGVTETTVSQLDGPLRTALLSELDPALTYSIDVRAQNLRGSSPWSAPVTVRPLNLPPTVQIVSPAAGSTLRGTTRVEVVPTLPAGSGSTLTHVDACLYDTSAGYDQLLSDCAYVTAWSSTLESGKPLTLQVPAPYWLDTTRSLVLRAEVTDGHGRTGRAEIPVTFTP